MTEDEARRKLEKRLQDIDDLSGINTDAGSIVELDQGKVGRLSRMDAIQAQALAQETARRRKVEHAAIRAALARLDEGEWGYCQKCGEKIEAGRMAINLTAAVCAVCAGR